MDSTFPNISNIDSAYQNVQNLWHNPNPLWGTGIDIRSSENILLLSFYGSLVSEEKKGWLNAGRRLIDKTDINMLWHAKYITPMSSVTCEKIAACLDDYIQQYIALNWTQLCSPTHEQGIKYAYELTTKATEDLFSSLKSTVAATNLLFFMFPQLPIYPFSRGHVASLEKLGYSPSDNYEEYCIAFKNFQKEIKPKTEGLEHLKATAGNENQQKLITKIVKETDWQERRIADEILRQTANPELFGCDGNGQ